MDQRADVNSGCIAQHNFGEDQQTGGAQFYANASGTSTSLGLEMNPSKSGLGFDFIL